MCYWHMVVLIWEFHCWCCSSRTTTRLVHHSTPQSIHKLAKKVCALLNKKDNMVHVVSNIDMAVEGITCCVILLHPLGYASLYLGVSCVWVVVSIACIDFLYKIKEGFQIQHSVEESLEKHCQEHPVCSNFKGEIVVVEISSWAPKLFR